ncbi:MAG: UGSC family (seleno)protein [Candidatus Methylomirabilia bacterium]
MPKDDLYLDPTDSVAVPRKTAFRPASLDGKVITLLDISKAKGDHLLDRIEELLRERARPKAIVRKRKPTFARPAPEELREEILQGTDVVVEALADRGSCTTCSVHDGVFLPLTREEVQTLADKAWDEILARLTKQAEP